MKVAVICEYSGTVRDAFVRESTKIAGNWFYKGGKDRQKNRAKTFDGIAEAMVKQWGTSL